jgi:hypothetical protein
MFKFDGERFLGLSAITQQMLENSWLLVIVTSPLHLLKHLTRNLIVEMHKLPNKQL